MLLLAFKYQQFFFPFSELLKSISTLRDTKLGESESMQENLFPGLEDQQNIQKESEGREIVSQDGLLEEHQDVPSNRLLEKHWDEEVYIYQY